MEMKDPVQRLDDRIDRLVSLQVATITLVLVAAGAFAGLVSRRPDDGMYLRPTGRVSSHPMRRPNEVVTWHCAYPDAGTHRELEAVDSQGRALGFLMSVHEDAR